MVDYKTAEKPTKPERPAKKELKAEEKEQLTKKILASNDKFMELSSEADVQYGFLMQSMRGEESSSTKTESKIKPALVKLKATVIKLYEDAYKEAQNLQLAVAQTGNTEDKKTVAIVADSSKKALESVKQYMEISDKLIVRKKNQKGLEEVDDKLAEKKQDLEIEAVSIDDVNDNIVKSFAASSKANDDQKAIDMLEKELNVHEQSNNKYHEALLFLPELTEATKERQVQETSKILNSIGEKNLPERLEEATQDNNKAKEALEKKDLAFKITEKKLKNIWEPLDQQSKETNQALGEIEERDRKREAELKAPVKGLELKTPSEVKISQPDPEKSTTVKKPETRAQSLWNKIKNGLGEIINSKATNKNFSDTNSIGDKKINASNILKEATKNTSNPIILAMRKSLTRSNASNISRDSSAQNITRPRSSARANKDYANRGR